MMYRYDGMKRAAPLIKSQDDIGKTLPTLPTLPMIAVEKQHRKSWVKFLWNHAEGARGTFHFHLPRFHHFPLWFTFFGFGLFGWQAVQNHGHKRDALSTLTLKMATLTNTATYGSGASLICMPFMVQTYQIYSF